MSKVKYYYDPETLSYKKIETKKGRRIRIITLWIVASFLAGIMGAIFLLNINVINTPRELSLERENKQYEIQYDIMNQKMEQMADVLKYIEEKDNAIYRTYFEANPIPDEQRRAGFGGVNRYSNLDGYNNSTLIKSTRKRIDTMMKQIAVQSRSLDEIIKLAKDKEQFLEKIPAIQPVRNEDLKRMASGYGWRSDPFTKARKFHYGMDFTAPRGTPVYASGDGTVARADHKSSGYGEHIRIDHGYGYLSLYAHLSRYNVRAGQKVKRGDLIGYVGSTGRSEAPHLHYEVWKDGERINPMNFYYGSLTKEEFDAMLEASSLENQSLD